MGTSDLSSWFFSFLHHTTFFTVPLFLLSTHIQVQLYFPILLVHLLFTSLMSYNYIHLCSDPYSYSMHASAIKPPFKGNYQLHAQMNMPVPGDLEWCCIQRQLAERRTCRANVVDLGGAHFVLITKASNLGRRDFGLGDSCEGAFVGMHSILINE